MCEVLKSPWMGEIQVVIEEGAVYLVNSISDKRVRVEPDYQSGYFILLAVPSEK